MTKNTVRLCETELIIQYNSRTDQWKGIKAFGGWDQMREELERNKISEDVIYRIKCRGVHINTNTGAKGMVFYCWRIYALCGMTSKNLNVNFGIKWSKRLLGRQKRRERTNEQVQLLK